MFLSKSMNTEKKLNPEIHCAHDELKNLAELVEHPRNPNTHSDQQIQMLGKIIAAQGWRAPIVVSKRSGFIVAGHARLKAAYFLGLDNAPVNLQDFKNEAEEMSHLLADNKIAELAELNFEGVANILKDLTTQNSDLDLTGFLDFEREPLLAAEWSPAEVGDLDPHDGNASPIAVTIAQREVFERAAGTVATDTDDNSAREGRVVELLSADYLAG
jgi:hypothetical protein